MSSQVVLRKLFERLGATYIKLGQFIASSPTLFPPEYVMEFEKCLDRTEPVPWEVIRATIASELGSRPVESVFSSVDPTPLASASVAQVHAAGDHCFSVRFSSALIGVVKHTLRIPPGRWLLLLVSSRDWRMLMCHVQPSPPSRLFSLERSTRLF